MSGDLLVRNNRILALHNAGVSAQAIGHEFGLSTRQIQRIITGRLGVRLDGSVGSKQVALDHVCQLVSTALDKVVGNTERCALCSEPIGYCEGVPVIDGTYGSYSVAVVCRYCSVYA